MFLRFLQSAAGAAAFAFATVAGAEASVLTYHNDPQRTGWNRDETILTPAVVAGQVAGKSFGPLGTVTLDEQVDAQALVVRSEDRIRFPNGKEAREVVYVATENNSVYAIEGGAPAYSGAAQVLHQVNLGTAVAHPSCSNNADVIGINSTPVIDPQSRTIYVVSYQMTSGAPAFWLYALGYDLHVKDRVLIQGSSGGIDFDPNLQRQRSALLHSSHAHRITMGFASYCDQTSRGWVFSLPVLGSGGHFPSSGAKDFLIDAKPSSSLSSVWMSGAGIAEGILPDEQGRHSIYFVTGNTFGGFDATTDKANSLLKLYPDLSFQKMFTPSNESTLDGGDLDFGSGGLVVVDPRFHYAVRTPRGREHLTAVFTQAYAAGKDGQFYAVDRQTLTGVAQEQGLACHCTPSAFEGADGRTHLVMSTGSYDGDDTTTVHEYVIHACLLHGGSSPDPACQANAGLAQTPPHAPPGLSITTKLVQVGPSVTVPTVAARDGGGFTSISSRGTEPGTGIIWLVTRAEAGSGNLHLFAYGADTLAALAPAGGWPAGAWSHYLNPAHTDGANSNVVPTVANGRVYVASDKELRVFGVQ